MNISTIIGEQIIHKAFGLGTIDAINGEILIASFNGVLKKLSVSAIVSNELIEFQNKELLQVLCEYNLQLNRARVETEVNKRLEKNVALSSKVSMPKYKPNGNNKIWIKFEGPQNENKSANLHSVSLNGKTLYVLNYTNSKKPSSVKENDEFFMAEGVSDDYGKPCQVITGRGHLCAFSETNVSPESWHTDHPWMKDRQWYVIIKDFEALDTCIKNGIPLKDVIDYCGSDTYVSSYGENRDIDSVKKAHMRRIHMELTEDARDYINKAFDKLKAKYGSKEYKSEI